MKTRFTACMLLLILLMLNGVSACLGEGAEGGLTVDLERTDAHEEITWDLIQMVGHNPSLKALLEQSIRQAHAMNPDPDTNPVSDLESYYAFIDRCCRCLPWEISPCETYDSLYRRIDQSIGCLYFVCDQPLEALEPYGYYHNSLMYHEPFRSWFIKLVSVSATFLNEEDSWCDEYYQNALQYPDFHLDDDTYESPDNWKTFNDFFSRRLKDASRRPIASPEDDRIVIAPADSVPQGLWRIDANSRGRGGAGIPGHQRLGREVHHGNRGRPAGNHRLCVLSARAEQSAADAVTPLRPQKREPNQSAEYRAKLQNCMNQPSAAEPSSADRRAFVSVFLLRFSAAF